MIQQSSIDPADQWLDGVRRVISPNCNERPLDTPISLLVIHNISLPAGEFGNGYIEQLFTNCLDCQAVPAFHDLNNVEVSAHLLIDRQGFLTQFVPFNKRAWHAGASNFKGCENCNDFSIGIELEGVDDYPYTETQYKALNQVTREIMSSHSKITQANIVGHSDIAPGRKTDPGPAFDWGKYIHLLNE